MPMTSSPASCNIDVAVSLGHDFSQSELLVNDGILGHVTNGLCLQMA